MARRSLVITSKRTLKFLIKTFLSQIVDEYFKATIGFSKNFFVNLHINYRFCRLLRVSRRFLAPVVQLTVFSLFDASVLAYSIYGFLKFMSGMVTTCIISLKRSARRSPYFSRIALPLRLVVTIVGSILSYR